MPAMLRPAADLQSASPRGARGDVVVPASFLEKVRGFFSRRKRSPSSPAEAGGGTAPGTATTSPARGSSGEGFARVFRYLDGDGDGKISPSELRSGMRGSAWEELSAEEAVEAVESTDSDGDGLLSFEDFVKLVDGGGEEERAHGLREAFGRYEMKGRGCITAESLRRTLRRLGEAKTVDECKAMIRCFDVDGDGVLSFDEFKLMML